MGAAWEQGCPVQLCGVLTTKAPSEGTVGTETPPGLQLPSREPHARLHLPREKAPFSENSLLDEPRACLEGAPVSNLLRSTIRFSKSLPK